MPRVLREYSSCRISRTVALIASLSKASITQSYTFTIVSDNKRRCSNSASGAS